MCLIGITKDCHNNFLWFTTCTEIKDQVTKPYEKNILGLSYIFGSLKTTLLIDTVIECLCIIIL